MLQGFKAFFSDLAKPDEKYFQQSIIDSIQDIVNSITPTKVELTMEELNTAIQKLKRNKAPRFDNVLISRTCHILWKQLQKAPSSPPQLTVILGTHTEVIPI